MPSLQLRARAELELRRRHPGGLRLLPRPFGEWLEEVSPASQNWHWEWAHLVYIRSYLQALTDGTITKLMVLCPPRHGKSEQDTIRYPVWRLECDPSLRVIIGAYNQGLAERFSRSARRIAVQRMALSEERNTSADWETLAGGGVRAVGVGSGVTGHGGNLVALDDPIKSREEAGSPAYRERVWEWYSQDITTRLEPGAAMLLTMTHWHEDDLAGRILASEDAPNWTVVSLPAEAEEGDPLGRAIGEPLCPARYDRDALAQRRMVLGPWAYAALFQQRPMPAEGGLVKPAWFQIVAAVPEPLYRMRYWDNAATEGGGAYTAGVRMGVYKGIYYIEDVTRGQWSTEQRRAMMIQTAQLDVTAHKVPRQIWFEREGGSAGKDSSNDTIKMMGGYPIYSDRVTGSKDVRMEPFIAQAAAGNVKLLRGAWNAAWLDELAAVPSGKYRDQADATSGVFNKLALAGGSYTVGEY